MFSAQVVWLLLLRVVTAVFEALIFLPIAWGMGARLSILFEELASS